MKWRTNYNLKDSNEKGGGLDYAIHFTIPIDNFFLSKTQVSTLAFWLFVLLKPFPVDSITVMRGA